MPKSFRHLTRSAQVLVQEVGGEAVLLDLRSEKYFGLNAVGLRVWQMLQEDSDVKSLRRRMMAEYNVNSAELDRDLDDLLTRLVDAGLLTVSEQPE